MNEYRKFLEDNGFNTASQWTALTERATYKLYKKGELIVKEGSADSNVYFLENGCVRYFFNKGDIEYTSNILLAPTAFAAVFNLNQEGKSEVNIDAITDTDLYILNQEDHQYLNENYPVYREIAEWSMQEMMKQLTSTGRKITSMSPEERYLDFVENNSELLKIVPLQIIASFLGIRPESLSRIRKRMYLK